MPSVPPRVSIILPVYNRARFLPACLESILAQTYARFEVLIIDDGSSDATPAVLAAFARRDPQRLRVVRQSNAGPYVARNRGLELAAGEFIAFADSDDRLHPEKLARQVAVLDAQPQVVLVYTHCAYRDAGGARRVPGRRHQPTARGDLRLWIARHFGGRIPWATAMVRAEAMRRAGPFETRFRAGMDREMGMRLARRGDFEVIAEPLYEVELHGAHVSQDMATREAASTFILNKLIADGELPAGGASERQARARMHLELAALGYVLAQTPHARRHLAAARRAHPLAFARPAVLYLAAKIAIGRPGVRRLARVLGRRREVQWVSPEEGATGPQAEA